MARLEVQGLHKAFGKNAVCRGIDLTVETGEMVCLIGSSGSGKSTLLRCLNLLEPIDDGVILLDGIDISVPGLDPQPVRQRIGMVFQSFNLFPHMTAVENVMLAPRRVHGRSREDLVARRHRTVRAVRLGRPDGALSRPAFRRAAAAGGDCACLGDAARDHAVRRDHQRLGPRIGGRGSGRACASCAATA